jgi:hypothetical protein
MMKSMSSYIYDISGTNVWDLAIMSYIYNRRGRHHSPTESSHPRKSRCSSDHSKVPEVYIYVYIYIYTYIYVYTYVCLPTPGKADVVVTVLRWVISRLAS